MEERARQAGCDLILDPYVTVAPTGGDVRLRHDPGATALRLRTLQESIESMPDEKVRHSTKLFAERVMPQLRDLWPEHADDDRFWIHPLEQRRTPGPVAGGMG